MHIKYRITAEVLRERSGLTRGVPIAVFVLNKNRADIRDGNEYKIRKWLVLKFHGSGHLQIILHLNRITECLKITTFKIVFTFDVFFRADTTCTARSHVFYIRNRHISVSSFVYKYDQ